MLSYDDIAEIEDVAENVLSYTERHGTEKWGGTMAVEALTAILAIVERSK